MAYALKSADRADRAALLRLRAACLAKAYGDDIRGDDIRGDEISFLGWLWDQTRQPDEERSEDFAEEIQALHGIILKAATRWMDRLPSIVDGGLPTPAEQRRIDEAIRACSEWLATLWLTGTTDTIR